jgi:hypothetical protein
MSTDESLARKPLSPGKRTMNDQTLTAEQEAQAQAIYQRLKDTFDNEARRLSRLMASKTDGHLLGDTEFQVRDRVHALGAEVLHIALDERKKGGTEVPAPSVPPVRMMPAALVGVTKRS